MCQALFFFLAVCLVFFDGTSSDDLTPAAEQLSILETFPDKKNLNMDFSAFRNVLGQNITVIHRELQKFEAHATWSHRLKTFARVCNDLKQDTLCAFAYAYGHVLLANCISPSPVFLPPLGDAVLMFQRGSLEELNRYQLFSAHMQTGLFLPIIVPDEKAAVLQTTLLNKAYAMGVVLYALPLVVNNPQPLLKDSLDYAWNPFTGFQGAYRFWEYDIVMTASQETVFTKNLINGMAHNLAQKIYKKISQFNDESRLKDEYVFSILFADAALWYGAEVNGPAELYHHLKLGYYAKINREFGVLYSSCFEYWTAKVSQAYPTAFTVFPNENKSVIEDDDSSVIVYYDDPTDLSALKGDGPFYEVYEEQSYKSYLEYLEIHQTQLNLLGYSVSIYNRNKLDGADIRRAFLAMGHHFFKKYRRVFKGKKSKTKVT